MNFVKIHGLRKKILKDYGGFEMNNEKYKEKVELYFD